MGVDVGNRKIFYNYVKTEINGLSYMAQRVDGQLKRSGGIYFGRCPIHSERTASFAIYPINYNNNKYDSFYCFGCGKGGDVIKFRSILFNESYYDAALALATEFNIDFNDDTKFQFIKQAINELEATPDNVLGLDEVNFTLSRLCYNYFQDALKNNQESIDKLMSFLNNTYQFIDEQLAECNAYEAEGLIKLIGDMLDKRRDGSYVG